LNRIRFNDVSASYHEQQADIDAALAAVVARGDFINGSAVREFEQAFAGYCGCGHAVGVSNGTSALHLALTAAGVRPGQEVITTPMTFIATAEAITHAGAQVLFADIDSHTLNLSPAAVEASITPATRAVLFVHLHGNPAGIEEIAEICNSRNLQLIEDCAQAHGALLTPKASQNLTCALRSDGRAHVGSLGTAAAYSFFPAKNLGAFGDAGAVTTSDQPLAQRVRMLANHGRTDKYLHEMEGYNYRLDTLQAAILLAKLRHLDEQVEQRNRLAAIYEAEFASLPLTMQQQKPGTRHARHLFVVHTDQRDALQKHLAAHDIETGIHYPVPLHLQQAYAYLGHKAGSFPNAERAASTTLSLPLYPQLPEAHAHAVAQAVRNFFA
jgi:dTDP-4-amino-4,6-dideoxygalactose transaminase